MNEKNVTYLQDNLKYMGFGEQLYPELFSKIQEGKKDFTLQLDVEINKKPLTAVLHFRQSSASDMYFFNKWDATLKDTAGKMQQTFFLNKGSGVTLKEGFNL